MKNNHRPERGSSMLLVVVFIATAVAGLAAISSGRVLTETRHHHVLESEATAYNRAYAQLHLAINVVNNSAYDDENHNLVLRDAIDGRFGGTVTGAASVTFDPQIGAGIASGYEAPQGSDWLQDPTGVTHGFVQGTEVRVYRGRDYLKRLQALKGEMLTEADKLGLSDCYFVLEAAGRAGDTVRLVSALVRENEPFSSFVFFQNQHTLGVSGAPRGLIHANDKLAFYFPNGNYVDPLSAVKGFTFTAGATEQNTSMRDANPAAQAIALDATDFETLRTKADLYLGDPGLDAEISFSKTGKVSIRPHTPPGWALVQTTTIVKQLIGYQDQTVTVPQQVQVGTVQVPYQEQVIDHYNTEYYMATVPVYQDVTVTYQEVVPVYQQQLVTKTRQVPVYQDQLVTKTRQVLVFVPYSSGGDAGGGTSVGGGGAGQAGEYVRVTETYQVMEKVQVGTTTETYQVTENVQVGTQTVTRTRVDRVQTGTQEVQQSRQVPVYVMVTKYRTDPVYATQDVQVTQQVPVYQDVQQVTESLQWQAPVYFKTVTKDLSTAKSGTIYVDGRVTKLSGDLYGRLTIVGNEKVRITGNIRYVDSKGQTAMLGGADYTQPYARNPAYTGTSVLGIIARGDVVVTSSTATQSELNGTLMSVEGRVGIDGMWLDPTGEPVKDSTAARNSLLTAEQRSKESAYDLVTAYKTRSFVKDSLRRIGGVISNNRILETYIKPRSDGTSYVDAGFKRGNMKFDYNLLFNPPPNFVEVPRPVVTYFAPVFFVRNNEG